MDLSPGFDVASARGHLARYIEHDQERDMFIKVGFIAGPRSFDMNLYLDLPVDNKQPF